MRHYVQLHSISEYYGGTRDMAVTAFIILSVIIVAMLTHIMAGRRNGESVSVSISYLAVFMSVAMIMGAELVAPSRHYGTPAGDDIPIIQEAYHIRGIQAKSGNPDDLADYLNGVHDGTDRYLQVVAQPEDSGSVRNLTFRIDNGSRLRVYEKTGDGSHLITPAATGAGRNGEA